MNDEPEVEVTEEEQEAFEQGQEVFQMAPQRDNPYVSEEDQGVEMKPFVMGPPQYGSPDARTATGQLVRIEDHPLTDEISEDYGADVEPDEEENGEAAEGDVNATAGAVELAEAEGVDLSEIEGSGSGGRVTKADVEEFLASKETE